VDAVIKVGGSLADTPAALKLLGAELSRLAKKHEFAVVPGGGKIADVVRKLDLKFALPSAVTHQMAILAMDQYGLLLSQVIPDSCTFDSLEDARKIFRRHQVAVLLASKLLFMDDPFEPSWDVTSDSISAYIAVKWNAFKAIFVTDVDGIFTKDPKRYSEATLLNNISAHELLELDKRTSVDKFLPNFLEKNPLDCYIVNGLQPKRVAAILSGKKTVCTRISDIK
jgi:5-(aminomethyl)-3-furanmethanol phosphate kinase